MIELDGEMLDSVGKNRDPAGCHDDEVADDRVLGAVVSGSVAHHKIGAGALDPGDGRAELEPDPPAQRARQKVGQVPVEARQQLVGELQDDWSGTEVLQYGGGLNADVAPADDDRPVRKHQIGAETE